MIVYKITNKINGKIYIGQTVRSLEKRWSCHCSASSKCLAISRAIQKYGKDNFSIEVIDTATSKNELNEKEKYWIAYYDSVNCGYNCTYGGDGVVATDEVKRKISLANTGRKLSKESRRKLSIKKRDLYKDKNNHPRYGKKLNEEQRKRLSEAHIGFVMKEETKRKISEAEGKKVINIDTGKVFNSILEAKKYYRLKGNHIGEVCKGKRKTCGGYHWKYYYENMKVGA